MIPIMERMTARTTAADAIITSTFQRTVEFMMTLILLQKKCAVTVEEETPLVRFQIYEFRVKLALKSLKIKNYQRLFFLLHYIYTTSNTTTKTFTRRKSW